MALKPRVFRRRQENPTGSMTIIEHLTELRKRLVLSVAALAVGMAVAWPLYGPVFRILGHPYCRFMLAHPQLAVNPKQPCVLFFSSIVEPFLTKLKVVAALGFIVALPVILFEFWRFVTPGLTSRERKYAVPFVFASVLLFIFGGWFALLTLPKGLGFLLGFAGTRNVSFVLSIGKYIGFVTLLVLAFGASFEFPVVLVSLELAGVLSTKRLRKWRRQAILFIAIFAAVITPSQDWFTMTAMMVPLIVFYELSIVVGRVLKK